MTAKIGALKVKSWPLLSRI